MSADATRVDRLAGPPPGWDDLVGRALESGFFHRAAWSAAVGRHLPGCAPFWLAATDGSRLLGGLAGVSHRRGPWRRIESHLQGTPGGPLVEPALDPAGRQRVAGALLAAWRREAARAGVVAAGLVLAPAAEAAWGALAAGPGWRRRDLPAAVLPLAGGLEAVEYGVLPKNRRNERNRALRRGCVAGVSRDAADLEAFYPVYAAAARRWGESPAPLGLLTQLLADPEGDAFLSWVRREGVVIGGHVCFHHRGEVTAWIGATRPEQNEVFPATLLVWTDIEEACRRGASRLDLGGSGGSATVARFKELMGARTELRGHYVRESALYAAARALRRRAGRGGGPEGRA